MQPYWGSPTASEDWCEANYVVTPYIAEFWNTLSNLPIILSSLYSIYLGITRGQDFHLVLPSVLLFFVGIGSTIFHGTLSYMGQAIDELSMVLAATAFLYVCLEGDARRRSGVSFLGPLLVAWSCAFIAAYVWLKNTNYFIVFVVVFVFLSTRCCYGAYLLHLRTSHPTLRTLFWCGQIVWASAFILFWLPDKLVSNFHSFPPCPPPPSPLAFFYQLTLFIPTHYSFATTSSTSISMPFSTFSQPWQFHGLTRTTFTAITRHSLPPEWGTF